MLRRRITSVLAVAPSSASSLLSHRHQSSSNDGSSNNDSNKTAAASANGFSFKRGPNAERLSSAQNKNINTEAKEKAAHKGDNEESAAAAEAAKAMAKKLQIRAQQEKERAPFLGMLNSLSAKADERRANASTAIQAAAMQAQASSSSSSSASSSSSKTAGGSGTPNNTKKGAAPSAAASSSSSGVQHPQSKLDDEALHNLRYGEPMGSDGDHSNKGGLFARTRRAIYKYRPSNLVKANAAALANERRKKLVFRDESGGSLDRLNLLSDPFLFVKYLRFGAEYSTDSELERRLRYYKEHAAREIVTSDGGKISRGPSTLFPLRPVSALLGGGGNNSNNGSSSIGSSLSTPKAPASSPSSPTVGLRGFILASVAGTPHAASVTSALNGAGSISGSSGGAPSPSSSSSSLSAKEAAAAATGSTTTSSTTKSANTDEICDISGDTPESEKGSGAGGGAVAYFPAAPPAAVLGLPRIVASNLAQFVPPNLLLNNNSSSSTKENSKDKEGLSSSLLSSPLRVNGAYSRLFQRGDDITKEKRVSAIGRGEENSSSSSSAPKAKAFMAAGTTQHVFAAANFKRPAVLIISQLGVKLGTEANNAWACAALKYLEPNSPFITLFDAACNSGNVYGRNMRDARSVTAGGDDATIKDSIERDRERAQSRIAAEGGADLLTVAAGAAVPSGNSGSRLSSSNNSNSGSSSPKQPLKRPIDLYCLRTIDIHPYEMVDKIAVRRFGASMGDLAKQLEEASASSSSSSSSLPSPSPSPYLFGSIESIAKNTFVGKNLLANFFDEPFRLRNYIATTCLLVDHRGRVRWISSGRPDEVERALMPKLLRDLEAEYLAALSGKN